MQVASEIAKLKREVQVITDLVTRARTHSTMTPSERRQLKSEIEYLVQRLDELRTLLSN